MLKKKTERLIPQSDQPKKQVSRGKVTVPKNSKQNALSNEKSHPISSGQESGRQNSRREIQGSGRGIRRTKQSGQACPLRSVWPCRTGWCRR